MLDTSAVLALLFGEAGAETVAERGAGGVMSAVSYSEALAKAGNREAPLDTIHRMVASLQWSIVPFDELIAYQAASLRGPTRRLNYSFADRACLATAVARRLPVLTADRRWADLDLGVEVVLLRP